jgi:hypothetical protein
MEKVYHTWALMKSSWSLLRDDLSLMCFPFLAALCIMLLTFPQLYYFAHHPQADMLLSDIPQSQKTLWIIQGVLNLYACHIIMVFFDVALMDSIMRSAKGEDTNIRDGLLHALGLLPSILGWAMIVGTVHLIVSLLRSKKGLTALAGSAMNVAFKFVVFLGFPIMVIERCGPFEALKRSSQLITKTWGRQLVAFFSFGAIASLMAVPGIILYVVVGAQMLKHGFSEQAVGAVYLVYMLLIWLIISTLSAVFRLAVYVWATENKVLYSFSEWQISGSFGSSKGL